MKPYEHISILLTREGNRTLAVYRRAATGAAKHLFLGVLLPQLLAVSISQRTRFTGDEIVAVCFAN